MLIQLMGVAPLLVCKNVTFPRKPLQIYWLVCRGVTGSFSVICAYFAVQHIGVGDALAIFFSNPVFTVFFAWMFLREKLSPIDLLLAVFTVSGVVLIVQPSFIFGGNNTHEKHSRIKGAAVALVGAVFAALVYICLKKLKTGIHLLIPIFYYALCGIIISSVSLSILQAFIVPQCRKDRIILFLIGAFAVVGQLFFTKAVQLEKAAYIAIIRSLDVVFSFIFEYFAFGRIPNLKVVAGTMLILSSAVCVAVKKMLAKSNKSQ
ncbi:solute carrier family 35 member G1-like [Saccoglossus kowalevskii]